MKTQESFTTTPGWGRNGRRFGLTDCKRVGAVLEVSPKKVTDSLWDPLCKVVLLAQDEPLLFWRLWLAALEFTSRARASGQPWRLRDVREARRQARERSEAQELDLRERMHEGRADLAEVLGLE